MSPVHAAPPYAFVTPEASKSKKKKMEMARESSIAAPVEEVAEEALSSEEKKALAEAINLLPERLIDDAINIICEADFVNDEDDEIHVDIDDLDTKIQRKLQRFIVEVRLPSILCSVLLSFETCCPI